LPGQATVLPWQAICLIQNRLHEYVAFVSKQDIAAGRLFCFSHTGPNQGQPKRVSVQRGKKPEDASYFMTLQQSEQIIREYQQVLSDDTKRGSRRDPSLLPASKERIMKAIKLAIAQLFLLNSHTNEDLIKPLTNAAMFLDSFNELPLETSEYIESMHRRRREIDSYYVELIRIDRTDSFYWQRVFNMIGIGSETRKTSFLDGMRQRLGMGSRGGLAEVEALNGRRPVGRLTID